MRRHRFKRRPTSTHIRTIWCLARICTQHLFAISHTLEKSTRNFTTCVCYHFITLYCLSKYDGKIYFFCNKYFMIVDPNVYWKVFPRAIKNSAKCCANCSHGVSADHAARSRVCSHRPRCTFGGRREQSIMNPLSLSRLFEGQVYTHATSGGAHATLRRLNHFEVHTRWLRRPSGRLGTMPRWIFLSCPPDHCGPYMDLIN